MQTSQPPLIITIALNKAAQAYFTDLRNAHFPKHVNYLEAHLTLFHHLPEIDLIGELLGQVSQRPFLDLFITGVKNIGNGVAFTIESDELKAMHKRMQQSFDKYLISQDRQTIWPHITVQNKVTAFKAAQTTALLSKDFTPFVVQGTGFAVWRYLKGPWEHRSSYTFLPA